MSDFFEIDFLDVESSKSGDAILIRYRIDGLVYIHVVDGGFQATGDTVVDNINRYYDRPDFIDSVVVSHSDGDHAGGLRSVLEEFRVGALWMLRPWLYANELIYRFSRYSSVENLAKRLRQLYPNIAALEEIALANNIPIYEPFQGQRIGKFTVIAPTRKRYLDLIVQSEKTPESVKEIADKFLSAFSEPWSKVISLIRAAWGEEVFSSEETSAENDMSVVQFVRLCNQTILLTADAGRGALNEAADYAPFVGLALPGIDRFQVPHHGSRRNVSTEVLDRWLGERLPLKPNQGEERFTAIVSAAEKDKAHPRKAVIRAMIHRGAKVISTEGSNLRVCGGDAPSRDGWYPADPLIYPIEQED